jgi:hypothetical protein
MTTTIRHLTAPMPMGCRWCGVDKREHGQRWVPGRGFHGWVRPTTAQIEAAFRSTSPGSATCAVRASPEEQPLLEGVSTMKVWYDTEFWERGPSHPIDLISIGMIREDGEELYLINGDAPISEIAEQHPWLRDNVLRQLPLRLDPTGVAWTAKWDLDHPAAPAIWARDALADQVRRFLLDRLGPLELWAWYGAYDHVVLAQLFGRMIDLPTGIPMWTNDLRQEVHRLGNPQMPEQPSGLHNALEDARHLRVMHEHLSSVTEKE